MADSVSKFSFVEVWLKKTADMMNSYKLTSPLLKTHNAKKNFRSYSGTIFLCGF